MKRLENPHPLAETDDRRRWPRDDRCRFRFLECVLAVGVIAGCTVEGAEPQRGKFRVTITGIADWDDTTQTCGQFQTPPAADQLPLPPNLGDHSECWQFVAEAVDAAGGLNTNFSGYTRLGIEPGAVNRVVGASGQGRNVKFVAGRAEAVAVVTSMFGPARLWVEDLGYEPAAVGVNPNCANGVDDDGDIAVDFPTDPGCAYADDMTEEGGSLITGVSTPVRYQLPAVADVQGLGTMTPYPSVALEIRTADHFVVVTRVASDGFYVTDINDSIRGYNHLYAYNFNTPEGMRVCDRLVYLTGTASEFFGFTEISFPSYEVFYLNPQGFIFGKDDCLVPEPKVLDAATIKDPGEMEKYESGLVRIENFQISSYFGSKKSHLNKFAEDQSNCDLNGDGVIDYFNDLEASCSNECSKSTPQEESHKCSEWNGYASRGNYRVWRNFATGGAVSIQINTSTVHAFNPLAFKGQVLRTGTGTLRNFSGGSLN